MARCIWYGDTGVRCKRNGKYTVTLPWQKQALALARKNGDYKTLVYCKKCLLEMLNSNLDSKGWKKLNKVKLS